MFRFLGSMVYNIKEMLLTWNYQQEEKGKERCEKDNKEQNKMKELFEKVNQVYEKYVRNNYKLRRPVK